MQQIGTGHRISLVLILLFGLSLRVVDLDRMPPFAHPDGANLAEYSQTVLRGDVPWYGVRTDGDPNWAFLQFAPYRLFGDDLWALRITAVLWSMLTLAATYYGVTQMFGARVALYATFLMAVGHLLVHFGRVATIVGPSVMTSFLSVGLFLRASRWQDKGPTRVMLYTIVGALLAANLYQYAAAKSVLFAVAALWLFALPRRREAWPGFLADAICLAAGFLFVAAPILQWYLQRPTDLFGRAEALSVFNPRYLATNSKLYGAVDTPTLLFLQTLRSLGGFATVWDTSPDYHIQAALLDPGSAVLLLPGLALALWRHLKLTLVMLVWLAAGLIGGAILLVEPPTSYHYIVLVPLTMVFAALCLERMSSSRLGRCMVLLLLTLVTIANLYLYFQVYPNHGAWYSVESDIGFYVRDQVHAAPDCCSFWYVGEADLMPRKISALIATLPKIHYVRDEDELATAIQPYLSDARTNLIIIPTQKANVLLPRLKQRFPGGRDRYYIDRGYWMFSSYILSRPQHTRAHLSLLK
jgi:4-amino-4-deoxy-L-arabinose transferase-like glycosyltransferase